MKVNDFITILEEQKGKELIFAYAENKMVGANYHLTEVKNVQYDTSPILKPGYILFKY